MNKRLLQIVLSFVFSFLTVWGCLEAMSPQIEAVDKSTAAASSLVFWHDLAPGVEATALQDLIGDFNASNPYSITVLGVYAGDTDAIRQQVIDGLRTGGPLPNIVTAYPSSLAEFARYGGIRFLDGYVKDPAVGITNTADFYPEVLSAFRLGEFADQLAGLPYGRSLELMYYNSRLLAGAGITVPTTWDAFESACVTMTSPTVSGTVIDAAGYAHFTNWLWSRGGMLLSGDLRRARFDEAAGIDSLLLFRRLMDGGYARRAVWTNEQFDAFLYGQAGFLFENSRGIEYLYTI
jgi:ABC-type glycerol-3-phosphate transport system substrate-binding protein